MDNNMKDIIKGLRKLGDWHVNIDKRIGRIEKIIECKTKLIDKNKKRKGKLKCI